MAKVHGSWIKEIKEKTKVGELGIFKAYVIDGIENFNLKRVFMASVSSEYSGQTGIFFYDNFVEAENEAKNILKKRFESFESEVSELRKKYDAQ